VTNVNVANDYQLFLFELESHKLNEPRPSLKRNETDDLSPS
jgi:hypothetical protein